MQITLPEHDITAAIKAYLIERGIVLAQANVDVSYLAKRKGGGLEARITFETSAPHAKASAVVPEPPPVAAPMVGATGAVPAAVPTGAKPADVAAAPKSESAAATPATTVATGTDTAEASATDPGPAEKEPVKLSVVPPNPDAKPRQFAAVAAAKAVEFVEETKTPSPAPEANPAQPASPAQPTQPNKPFAHLKGPESEAPLESTPSTTPQASPVEATAEAPAAPAKPKPTKSLFLPN